MRELLVSVKTTLIFKLLGSKTNNFWLRVKQHCIFLAHLEHNAFLEIAEMIAITLDLKNAKVVIPTKLFLQLVTLACTEDRWVLENDSGSS